MLQPTATIWAAFVGAASALLATFFKDFLIVRWARWHEKAETEKEVLRLYVAPLSVSCEKLVWRFAEIFLTARHQFLKSATLPLVYNEYKRQSTLFRIAALLGWLRAIQLELNSLPRGGLSLSADVGRAVEDVRKALGDGPTVELQRLDRLAEIWNLGQIPSDRAPALAAELERRLYAEAGDQLKHDARFLQQLDRDHKLRIARTVADFLCFSLKQAKLPQSLLDETVEQAILGMSYREALIYRDWQDAIGDLMLSRDNDSLRKYSIVGYPEFCQILAEDTLWMEVFRNSIVDIDFDEVDRTDYRGTQLAALSRAVANILLALAETEHRDLLPAATLEEARRLRDYHK